MIRVLPLFSLLTACNSLCGLVGDYTGTYEGDENGDVTLSITDDKGDTLLTVNLSGDIEASGSGSVTCEEGTFSYDLMDDAGNDVGDINGTVDDTLNAAGDYTTADGGTGTWSASGG